MNPFRTPAVVPPPAEKEITIVREATWEASGRKLRVRWNEGSNHVEVGHPDEGLPGVWKWARLHVDEVAELRKVLDIAILEARKAGT